MISRHPPAVAALLGGILAVVIGLWSMQIGGAPERYLYINGAAPVVGLALAALLIILPRRAEGGLAVGAALALLATALWGTELAGIRRWVSVFGILQVQPAFIGLPLILCQYARRQGDPWHVAAMTVAAMAIALQPDRSMSLALLLVAVAIWLSDLTRTAAFVLFAALAACGYCLWQSDPLDGVRFVEHVLVEAWVTGPLQGAVLSFGAMAMLAPLVTVRRVVPQQRRAILAFTACWITLLSASIVAPYPTPLLGYGPSAIIGYFLSIIALRKPAGTDESH